LTFIANYQCTLTGEGGLVTTLGHIKGSLLVHLKEQVVERVDERAWDRLVHAAPSADREHLGGLLLTGSWYPVGVWNRLLTAYLANHAPGNAREEAMAYAQSVADSDMHVLFKVALRLASPAMVTARAGSLWSRYFDSGSLTPTQVGESQWRLRLEAPTGEEEGPGQVLCAYGVVGWAEQALRLSGAKTASVVHAKCRFATGHHCEYRVSW
jgi:hypothetical protein